MRPTTTRWRAALACRCPPRFSLCLLVLPLEAGIGQAPQSLAKAASERIRSGSSPTRTSIYAAVAVPHAVRRDHFRRAPLRQPAEMGVVRPDLGIEVEPAPGDGAQ